MTQRRWPGVSRIGVPALIGLLVGLSAILALTLQDERSPLSESAWLTWWSLLPAFALAEVFVVHLAASRGAQTHSMREVPNVLGLAFLSPMAYLAAHLIGTGTALVLHRRQRGTKLAFNLAMFAFEVMVGVATYRFLLGSASPAEPRGWAAAAVTAIVTDLISAVMITAVIAIHEGEFDRSVVRHSVTRGVVAAGANTCVASLVIVLVTFSPSALPLLVMVLLVLYLTYRAYVSLWGRHIRVRQLYRLVQETGNLVRADELVAVVLREARQIMRASTAELIVLSDEGSPVKRVVLAGDPAEIRELSMLAGPPGVEWWHEAIEGRQVRSAVASCVQHGAACRGGVAAAVKSADATVIGVLLVHDRTVSVDPFSDDDAELFSTVAAHASVALENARLIDELRTQAADREHQALHDSLTGLPNRLALGHQLEEALDSGTATVLLLGVDLERVNEVLGHSAGEALLCRVADRLRDVAGGGVCRLDGPEFAIVMSGRAVADVRVLAERLLSALVRPLALGDVPLYVTGRAGIACAPLDGSDAATLLRHALAALHAASPGGVTFAHQASTVQDGERRLKLAADLSEALGSGGLEVWYQPQVDAQTRQLVGVEALLRWRHAEFSWVPAQEVIDIAERTGQLARVTEFVLTSALEARRAWLANGLELTVSMNVAAQTLHDDTFPERITRQLWETQTAPDGLVIEVTESGVMIDPERALRVLHEITGLGVQVAIDDFGTGHSSLAYLDRLPVREVKIDRSFVLPLDYGGHDSPVLRSAVALARELGLRVVAEGVETNLAASLLEQLGCDVLQGHLIGRPMPAHLLETWLANQHSSASERHGPLRAPNPWQ